MKDKSFSLVKRIGQSIAKKRMSNDLTQEFVAEKMGIGVEAISRIERGVSVPSITRLAQIAEILDCSLQELINESSPIASDQALHLTSLIKKLDEKDRSLVIGIVESLVSHLSDK